MASERRPERIPTLDGWRAIAILAVIVAHSDALFAPQGALPGALPPGVISFLRHGVSLFFAISGFLITRLLVLELTSTGTLSLKGFYLRRAFRILPLVFVYLGVLQALSLLVAPIAKPWEFTTTLLFVRNYVTHWPGPATIHFWSLSVEEHFYLLWPPVLSLVSRKRALQAACLLAFAVGVWRIADGRYDLFRTLFHSGAPAVFRTDTCFDALLWGAIPALSWEWTGNIIRRFARLPLTGASVLALPAVSALALYTVHALAPTLRAMVFALLLASTVFRPEALTARMLGWGPLRWVGRLSYSLYVWHILFLRIPEISFSLTAPASSQAAFYLLDLLLIFACSGATHYAVELPLQRLGRRVSASLVRHPLPAPSQLA